MRRLLAVAVASGLLLAPMAKAADPSGTPITRVQIVKGSVVPSTTLRDVYVFNGSGYVPRTPVTVAVDGLNVARVESTAVGDFTARLTLVGDRAKALTAIGLGPEGAARVVTAGVTPTHQLDGERRSPERTRDTPTRVYTNLLAGLAVVLFLVMVVIAAQAVRRRPGGPA